MILAKSNKRLMRLLKILGLAWLSLISLVHLCAQTGKDGPAEKKSGPSAETARTGVEKGEATYRRNCAICHFSASTQKKIGPGMKDLYKRGKFADGKKVDDTRLRAWIEKGGKQMPPFKDALNAEQIADLIAYLKTL